MDDVPDYMSAVFLQEAEPSKGDKRRNKLKRKRQPADKIKPAQEIQQERLEQGLLNPIDSSNKGFQMLMKMGFKYWQDKQTKELRTLASLHQDWSGIGTKTNAKESERFDPKKQKVSHEKVENFKKNISIKMQDKKIIEKLCSQVVINLDENAGKDPEKNPFLADWFMTERIREEAKKDPTIHYLTFEQLLYMDTPIQRLDRLEALLNYLRKTYNYCFYCGATYDSFEQLTELCPGLTEDEH